MFLICNLLFLLHIYQFGSHALTQRQEQCFFSRIILLEQSKNCYRCMGVGRKCVVET